jgi:hypothetical protein
LSQKSTDVRFDEWIKFIFDHPVTNPAWYWNIGPDTIEPDKWDEDTPATTAQYITRLFTNSRELLTQYSDGQVNQGLWYLVNTCCSDIMNNALDVRVPLLERLDCIRSIFPLFRDCFAARCSSHLSHCDQSGSNPINLVCYMWWDIFPTNNRLQEDMAVLDVMHETLAIPSVACRESALHGLGHWQSGYPKQVKQIISDFLASTTDLNQTLRQYALEAKAGYVQ